MCILAMVLCLERGTLSQAAQFIIIMEICKVPTLRLKTLNKHSITHIVYIKMEMLNKQTIFYFMSVHIEVILDKNKNI